MTIFRSRMRRPSRLLGCILGLAASAAAVADPWIAPADARVRHDIELLADHGLLRTPITSWPMSWPSIARDVLAIDVAKLDAGTLAAAERLREDARRAMRIDQPTIELRAAAAESPNELRGFEATPRESGEIGATISSTSSRFAWRVSGQYAADPRDGKHWRLDGSYLGVTLGNWMFSAGLMEKWWGPGWQGSLVLGTAARPIPSITVERNYAEPFELPVLRWLGPWRLSLQVGELEGTRPDVDKARFFGLRVNAKPHPSLEIGLARSAQWCGTGRPCGLGTFRDLMVGSSNTTDPSSDPGNQIAGFDVRWKLPGRIPVAFYGQAMGEDEAGKLPSKWLTLAGLETWGSVGGGTWRVHAEAADTACDGLRGKPLYGCGYTHYVYTAGYNYRGRSIGHAMGGDGRMLALGALYVDPRGTTWQGSVRSVDLNRAGLIPHHPLVRSAAKAVDGDLSVTRAFGFGTLALGLGYSDTRRGTYDSGFRGFLEWRTAL